MSTKFNSEQLLKAAEIFYKKAQAQMGSITPDQVAPILDKAGLWGGQPFNPNGKAADVIFGAMDKAGFQGKFDASIEIDSKLGVKVLVQSTNPKTAQLQAVLQSSFGPKMSQALRAAKAPPPAGPLTVGWLSGVANVQ